MKLFSLAILAFALSAAENKTGTGAAKEGVKEGVKEKDMCSPPPGSIAPSLPAHLMTGQGNIHFAITTTNPQAQKFFDQGVAQMHSFWAMEAERSFLQAAALDPEAPMPWWGVAMVAAGDYRPRHQLERDTPAKPGAKKASEPLKGGPARAQQAALKAVQLSEAPGKATDLEKLYIASIAARRQAPDSNAAYIAGLRQVLAQFPDEVEAGSYLALHLMRGYTLPSRTPRPDTMEAVALLRTLVVKFPEHAGVHHYIIHGWEGSSFASEAWPSCEKYPLLVTNIPHALHMPGHIWAQTGRWPEAEKSFTDAAANEISYMNADALYGNYHHAHNVEFLITTYGFDGDFAKAADASRSLMAFQENPRQAADLDDSYTAYRMGWFGLMRTLVTFERWDEILDGTTLPVIDKPREQAWRHWALGLAYASKGKKKPAQAELKLMTASLKSFETRLEKPVPPPLQVAEKELRGQIEMARLHQDRGLALLQEAADHERKLRYTEPPSYPRPVADSLAGQAVTAGKPQLARAAWQSALEQTPGDPRASRGLAAISKPQAPPNASVE